MRKPVLLFASLVMLCLLELPAAKPSASAADSPVKPFTATVHRFQYRANGSLAHEETYTVAYRSDGSKVSDFHRTLPNGEMVEMKEIADVSGGREITVDYATHSISTYAIQPGYLPVLKQRMSSCLGGVSAQQTILGYPVVLVHAGHTYGNGASNVHDRWEAPSLNCFALRQIDAMTALPPNKAPHNEEEVTNIALGEPDPSLFSVPENFVERSPSQRHAEFERLYGVAAPTPAVADQYYAAARPH